MSEKKVIAVIVEGPSDENAIGGILKEYYNYEKYKILLVPVRHQEYCFYSIISFALIGNGLFNTIAIACI